MSLGSPVEDCGSFQVALGFTLASRFPTQDDHMDYQAGHGFRKLYLHFDVACVFEPLACMCSSGLLQNNR